MWTTATLSQPKLNVQLPTVREDSELEDVSVSGKTLWSYDQKAGHDAEGGWEASDGGEDKDSFKPEEPEELELGGDSSQGSRLEEDDSKTDNGVWPHRAVGARAGGLARASISIAVKWGKTVEPKFLGFPERGAPR